MDSHSRTPIRSSGNASDSNRGWFIGPYCADENPLLAGAGIQVKWGVHTAGDARDTWDNGVEEWSLCLLVNGSLTLTFADGCETLESPGDFVMWQPRTPHTWRANHDSTVITVRWLTSSDS